MSSPSSLAPTLVPAKPVAPVQPVAPKQPVASVQLAAPSQPAESAPLQLEAPSVGMPQPKSAASSVEKEVASDGPLALVVRLQPRLPTDIPHFWNGLIGVLIRYQFVEVACAPQKILCVLSTMIGFFCV